MKIGVTSGIIKKELLRILEKYGDYVDCDVVYEELNDVLSLHGIMISYKYFDGLLTELELMGVINIKGKRVDNVFIKKEVKLNELYRKAKVKS